jgi:hypothetical protein
MTTGHHRDDGSVSTTSTDLDFLSPFGSCRKEEYIANLRSETLAADLNSSWIGARMSPIAFDEEEEDDRLLTAPYHQALRESIENSFMLNERSALLVNKQIHPLWDEPPPRVQIKERQRKDLLLLKSCCDWGTLVCATAAIHLACIALHDCYLVYISYRLGYDISVERWSLLWLSPSKAVLSRFGAFVPYRLLMNREWWRMLTSALTCSSVVELMSVVGAWGVMRMGGTTATCMCCWIYLLSVLTGQIWMMAWDTSGISGCAAWGTCGVLSASSGAKPRQRIMLLVASTVLSVLALLEPHNSYFGTIGATLFGWAFYGVGWSRVVSKKDRDAVAAPTGLARFFCGVIVLSLWIVPLLWIAFCRPVFKVAEPAFSTVLIPVLTRDGSSLRG